VMPRAAYLPVISWTLFCRFAPTCDAASQQRLPDLEEKLRCIVGLTSP